MVIGEVCEAFFYGPNRLASLFPEEFEDEVPVYAVALVVTMVNPLHLVIDFSHYP